MEFVLFSLFIVNSVAQWLAQKVVGSILGLGLFWNCMFSLHLHGFSPDSAASSHSPKTFSLTAK